MLNMARKCKWYESVEHHVAGGVLGEYAIGGVGRSIGAICQEGKGHPANVDRDNPLWDKPRQKRAQFNLGWMGTAADRQDLLMIKAVLEDCLQKIPQAQLVIAGDSMVYACLMVSRNRAVYIYRPPALKTFLMYYRNSIFCCFRLKIQFSIRLNPIYPWWKPGFYVSHG